MLSVAQLDLKSLQWSKWRAKPTKGLLAPLGVGELGTCSRIPRAAPLMLGENVRQQGAMGLAIQISQRRCQVPWSSGSLGLISLSEQPATRARASGECLAPGACTHTIVMDAKMIQISSSYGCTLQSILLSASTLRGGFSVAEREGDMMPASSSDSASR